MAHGWESKRAPCIDHKKTFSFVKLLHWLNIFETFCKKKNSCMELNIFRSKTVSQIATLFLLLFGQDWRKHDCFVMEIQFKTGRCELFCTIKVITEKKNTTFFFRQNFSIRNQKEKLQNFVCLCKIRRITEHAETDKKILRIKHFH